MGRYILRYKGEGVKPHADVRHFRALADVELIDESPRMLLVEAPAVEALQAAVKAAGLWTVSAENEVPLPPSHPDLAKPKPKPEPKPGPGQGP